MLIFFFFYRLSSHSGGVAGVDASFPLSLVLHVSFFQFCSFQVFSYAILPPCSLFLFPTSIAITLLSTHLFSCLTTWPNHLISLLSYLPPVINLLLTFSFFTLSTLVIPHSNLSILISATSNFSILCITTRVSMLYIIASLTTTLCSLPFTLRGTFWSHSTPDTFLQLFHPAAILFATFILLPLSVCTMDPRYLNSITLDIRSSPLSPFKQLVPIISSLSFFFCLAILKMFCLPSLESNVSACFFNTSACTLAIHLLASFLDALYSACFTSFSHSSAFFHSFQLLPFGFYCFLYLITPPPGLPLSIFAFCYITDCSCNFSHCFFNLVPLFLNSHTVLNIYIPFL